MKSVAQMVSLFESTSKNVKSTKHVKSPPKLIIPVQMKQRIIMPKGGIPKDYYASSSSQNPRPKSPRYIRNVEIAKPQKLDKEKIKNNMQNMKQLLEKKGIYKRPFIIEPPNYHPNKDNQDYQNNQDNQDSQINQNNQDNQINQFNENNQINENNKVNENNQNKQDNQINQISQNKLENKNNQTNQINQNNQKNKTVQNNQNNQNNKNNQVNKIEGLFSHNKFLAAKSIFETRNNEAINKNYQNKPVRKDVKKKAKSVFED